MKMGLKKVDIMTEAMEGFWGQSKKLESPQEVNVIGMSQDVITPQEAYDDYQAEGMSIKDKVEAGINETQDLTPDARMAARYSAPVQAKPVQQANAFDLGGLDAMNQRQLAKERGMGIGLEFGGAPKKPSHVEIMNKKQIEFEYATNKELAKLNLQERRLHINEFNRQSRSRAATEAEVKRTLRSDTQRKEYELGIPIYSGPLDFIAGGKTKETELNPITGKYQPTGRFVRTGGLFGAGKEIYKGYKTISNIEKSHNKRMEEEAKLYETNAEKKVREEAEKKEERMRQEQERQDDINERKARIKNYNVGKQGGAVSFASAPAQKKWNKPSPYNTQKQQNKTASTIAFEEPIIVPSGFAKSVISKTKNREEAIITPAKSIVPGFITNIFGGGKQASPTSFEMDNKNPFGYDGPPTNNKKADSSMKNVSSFDVDEMVNKSVAKQNKDKDKNPESNLADIGLRQV